MTVNFLKSELPPGFHDLVVEFQRQKVEHLDTVNVAAPSSPHPFVAAAVRRVGTESGRDTFVIDYTVTDDTPAPPPPPTVAELRQRLYDKISRAEDNARSAVIQPGHLKLLQLDVTDEVPGKAEALTEVVKAFKRIQRAAAEMAVEVDNLTEEGLKSYELRSFV